MLIKRREVQFKRDLGSLASSLLLSAALGSVILSACAPEKPSNARLKTPGGVAGAQESGVELEQSPVARVNDELITLGEFNRQVSALPEFARVRYDSAAGKQELLESVVHFEVMAEVARRGGFMEDRGVYFALKEALAAEVIEDIAREKASPAEISQRDIEAYYQAHAEEFRAPLARRVALIEIATREEAAQIRRRVEAEMGRAEDSPIYAFRRAAAAYSADPGATLSGGDIGFITAPGTPNEPAESAELGRREQIAQVIFELEEPGELSPIFGLDEGWGLAIFMEEREEEVRELEEAAADIRQQIHDERRREAVQAFIAQLKAEAAVEALANGASEGLKRQRSVQRAEDIRLSPWPVFEPSP